MRSLRWKHAGAPHEWSTFQWVREAGTGTGVKPAWEI